MAKSTVGGGVFFLLETVFGGVFTLNAECEIKLLFKMDAFCSMLDTAN